VLTKLFSYQRNRKINENILESFSEVTQTTIMPTVIDMIVNRKNAHARIQD
jgi:hypothetical protein